MYIRRTQTRSNATGEPYFTYRLVRSERIGGKVKQVTLLNLGRHFAVDQSLWPALCVRIDELLADQPGRNRPAQIRRRGSRSDCCTIAVAQGSGCFGGDGDSSSV